jgi:hypothetical protein
VHDSSHATASRRSTLLHIFAAIEGHPLNISAGRSAAVAIGGLRNAFAYKRVPDALVATVVRCLIGATHIPFKDLRCVGLPAPLSTAFCVASAGNRAALCCLSVHLA